MIQMRHMLTSGMVLTLSSTLCSAHNVSTSSEQLLRNNIAALSVPFIQNVGQQDSRVAYYARTLAGTVFVSKQGGLVYSLPVVNPTQGGRWAFEENFLGTGKLEPRAETTAPTQVNIFKGKAEQWRYQVPAANDLQLGQVAPGISIKLKAHANNVEKLFHVAPGADPAGIKVKISGVDSMAVASDGRLQLQTGQGAVYFTAPVAYQMKEGNKEPVRVAYELQGSHYGFQVGAYDTRRELIIDPLLASTFLGGTNANSPTNFQYDQDIVNSVVDAGDSIYVGGVTQSTDFPIVLGYDDSANASGQPDGFIARISSDLGTVLSSTYIGTEYFDRVTAIARDADGSIVATGQAGYGFPVTPGAYNYSGSEPVGGGFIARFSADLSTLLTSAVVTPGDYPLQLALGNGAIYFAGRTNNPGFPITDNALFTTCCPVVGGYGLRGYDDYIGKLSGDLTTLYTLTFAGGDQVTGLAIGQDGTVYLSDGEESSISGFLARYNADLSALLGWTSFTSTSGSSRVYFKDVAVSGNDVVAVGQTYLNDMPVSQTAFDRTCGSDGNCDNASATLYLPQPDGFIVKYSADLQSITALTYFGGSSADKISRVALDADANVYVAGTTASVDMPTSGNGYDRTFSGTVVDAFVAKLSPNLDTLLYGSYLGGTNKDTPEDIALQGADRLYVAGSTNSSDFPTTPGAFDRSYAGGATGTIYDTDAFISLFDTGGNGTPPGPDPTTNTAPTANAGGDTTVKSRSKVTLDGTTSSDPDAGDTLTFQWRQVSGKSVSLQNASSATPSFTAPRVRSGQTVLVFELTVTDTHGAMGSDQVIITVVP